MNSFFWRQVVAKSPVTESPAPEYENGWNAINQLIRQEYSWCGHEPNVLFVRRRAARYYDFSGVSGLDFADDCRAFAATDFDGDGNLDIVLKSRLGPQVRVLRNNWGWAVVRLRCDCRDEIEPRRIGARVEVDGRVKWLNAGSGFLSQHTKRMLRFGPCGHGRACACDVALRSSPGILELSNPERRTASSKDRRTSRPRVSPFEANACGRFARRQQSGSRRHLVS